MITKIEVVTERFAGRPQEAFYNALKGTFPSMPTLRQARTGEIDGYFERLGESSPKPELRFNSDGHLITFRTASSDRPIRLEWGISNGEPIIRSIVAEFPGGSWEAAYDALQRTALTRDTANVIVTLADSTVVSVAEGLRLCDEAYAVASPQPLSSAKGRESVSRWFREVPWGEYTQTQRRRLAFTFARLLRHEEKGRADKAEETYQTFLAQRQAYIRMKERKAQLAEVGKS